MAHIVIMHGTGGSPQENWIPYLASQLQEEGHHIQTPQFPIGEKQNNRNWKTTFEQEIDTFTDQTILVGHSLAGAFSLKILQDFQLPIHAMFMVSPFLHLLGNEEFDIPNSTFVEQQYDWNLL